MKDNYKYIYVAGHKNPDADSLISAYAYAYLKQLQGHNRFIAIRCGAANSQSEYIFNRFKTPLPLLMPDVIPKVMHHMQEHPICIHYNCSLWEALQIITEKQIDTIPIVDDDNKYLQLLCYESISLYSMKRTTDSVRSVLISSFDLIKSTINAQSLLEFNSSKIKGYTLLMAASYSATFKEEFDQEDPENLIVLIGDRIDLQRYIIERKVAMMIVTNNYIIPPELRELAKKNCVSILISSHDATSTSIMLLYSVPVIQAAIEVAPITYHAPLSRAKSYIENSTARAVAVVNDQQEVVGIIKEVDLNCRPNIALVLVDHNELSQGITGIEKVDILEIIDHHRLGGIKSNIPISFINEVVGSTSTIIANLYKRKHVPLDITTASLLLCGILSDTLGLKSTTTTIIDKDMANYLASLTQLNIKELTKELSEASNRIGHRTPQEIIEMDQKEYTESDRCFFISQVETSDPSIFLQNTEQYLAILKQKRLNSSALFCSLLITDTTTLSSYFMLIADEVFLSFMPYPKYSESIYFLENILSRKKQLIPIISEIIYQL